MSGAPRRPLVAVVVIGRNEGARLERCLRSVRTMEPPPGGFEVVYVDSASTDGSVARARRAGARVVLLGTSHVCAAAARNAGWRAVGAPFVLFLDGDTELHAWFVVRALEAMADERVAVVWGHRRERRPDQSVFVRVLDLDWIYPPGESELCGGDALVRRCVLAESGGYDESLIAGEEPELCRRIRAGGWTVLHLDVPMTLHDLAVTTWRQYWRRAVRAGYAYAMVCDRDRESGMVEWRAQARRNVRNTLAMIGALVVAGATAFVLRSGWPFAAVAVAGLLLVVRSAVGARWKVPSLATRLLYGVHVHVQQIPICWGQLAYWRDRRAHRARGLIEYKGAAP